MGSTAQKVSKSKPMNGITHVKYVLLEPFCQFYFAC